MAIFQSDIIDINASAQHVFDKLSNLDGLKQVLANVPADQVPADQREMFDAVRVDSDSISFPAGPVGEITLRVSEKVAPTLIRLTGVNTPVALDLTLDITPVSDNASKARVSIDIAIPAMLKPMIAGPLNKLVSQFAQMLPAVATASI